MQHTPIPLADTKAFSRFFLDYLQQKQELQPFYHRFPTLEGFADQISEKERCFPADYRAELTSALRRQYGSLKISEAVDENITALSEKNTFTVTTGHQLNIFTGPLYFIYKIVTVINTCKVLQQRYPDKKFVPVYWMASEDHDYDEIKYFRLYGRKYVWETEQKGAVGRFSTEGIQALLDQLPGDTTTFRDAYTKNKTLSAAARHYVNALFGSEGLVVVDGDDKGLKRLFNPVIREDVMQHTTVRLVNETNERLKQLGYKTQVFCRDINFFYLDNNIRNRIDVANGTYGVLDSDLRYTEEEMERMIEDSPEKFSPNVILRPLYQEWILPNLAYVGGPAENIYWLQLKAVFDYFKVPFPMLMPRNFAVIIDHTIDRKMKKTGLEMRLFFEDKNFLFNHWTLLNSQHNLSVSSERETIQKIYDQLRMRAESIDKTLGPFTGAEASRVIRSLDKIERKMLRAEKRLQSDRLRQIEEVKDALFPNGSLQERTDNFLNFYQKDPGFIEKLLAMLDPFDYQFHVLTYNGA